MTQPLLKKQLSLSTQAGLPPQALAQHFASFSLHVFLYLFLVWPPVPFTRIKFRVEAETGSVWLQLAPQDRKQPTEGVPRRKSALRSRSLTWEMGIVLLCRLWGWEGELKRGL